MTAGEDLLIRAEQARQKLFAKLQAMRRVLTGKKSSQSVVGGQLSAVGRHRSSVLGQQSAVGSPPSSVGGRQSSVN